MLLFIIATFPASAQLTPRRSTSALAPEPGTIALAGLALAGLGLARRRKTA